ncbi:protein CASC3 isoform X2 [Chelonus insularis]|uniref:protein CASC3 isoform X2 n=1 Tax=Chelonus insularis TaxID=460826 RepID=UPI00158F28FB|nr:protein CASC3 isoform X2 [Chelonus insularis]
MSDSRRRRKSEQSGASDDLSESYDELNAAKGTQSSEHTEGQRDSEYDTAGSDAESVGSQDDIPRERGDGQEEDKPQKKLDDDEDRRNPQYIPKRGTFYEHDDRTTEETAENAVEQPVERETKEKKVWKDKEDRWDHDRYNDEEQAPKSHEELIAVYGYDIRNEEGPPRARRRRRYGRGPNKYTRNWEDEDAYNKTSGSHTHKHNRRSNKTGEEFPALGGSNKDQPDVAEEPVISSAWYSNKNKYHNKQQNAFPPLQSQQENQKTNTSTANNIHTNENKAPNEPTNPAWKKEVKHTPQNSSPNRNNITGDGEKVVYTKSNHTNKRHVESVSLAASKARGRGFKPNANNNLVTNRILDLKPKGRGSGIITGDIRRNNINQHDEEQVINEIKHMNINDGSTYHHSGRQQKNFYTPASNQQRQQSVPPRMQPPPSQQPQQQQQTPTHSQPPPDVAGNRPKRYSSLRQRPTISEGPGQQNYSAQHTQHTFYPPQGYPQGHYEQPASVPTSANPLAAQPVIPMPTAGQPGTYAPPPFLVPPPQFLSTQTAPPSIINYVPGPNGPAFQPNFQGYQGYNPPVQPQGPPPPELYQPQGCTYYSPAQQPQQPPQNAPPRRPKAAIPILPPPDNSGEVKRHQSSRGRGRTVSQTIQNTTPGSVPPTGESEVRIDAPESTVKNSTETFDNMPVELTDEVQETSLITQHQPEDERKITVEEVQKPEPAIEIEKCISDVVISKVTIESPEVENSQVHNSDQDIIDDNSSGTLPPAKSVEIEAVSISETEITKVDSVNLNKNPVVEEAAA